MASRRRPQQPSAPTTANEQLLDALIRHQIGLLRLSGSVRNRMIELLDASEADISRAIKRRLRDHRGLDARSIRAMQALLKEVETIRAGVLGQAREVLFEEMRALALAEPQTLAGIVRTVAPVVISPKIPAAARLRAIVSNAIWEGDVMEEHFRIFARADQRRIRQAIQIGMTQGESPTQIARRLVGTAALNGANGRTELTRRQAETLARTATIATASEARREFLSSNKETLGGENLFVATLDSRTTDICMRLDGQRFPIDADYPRLPLHHGERSQLVFTIDAEALGRRPARRFTQRQLLREFTRENDLEVVTSRSRLPFGTKRRFDEFARVRMRELTGRTPATVTYQKFLERQSAANQDDILGPTRGRLFRRGGVTLEKFVDLSGRTIPLRELASSDAEAFRRAGLDPEDFL